jgi:RNA polymerase sigma-70 factor (ECF subfamily)
MDAGISSSRDGRGEPSSISSTLLERVRARQPEAWQRLADLYSPVVYRWCRQLGVSQADAADVVQDVFAAVTADVGRFRRDRPGDSFGAWLRTITRHRVCDHFRRRQGQPDADGGTSAYEQLLNLAEAPEEPSQAQPVEKEPLFARRMLDFVRAEFENRTWEAFWQIVVDGRSPAEVAAAMGLSLPAVYKAKSRVLRRLRQELGGLEPR